MTERTVAKRSLEDSDSDSISLTSTNVSEVDGEKTYLVDRILAEQKDDDGNMFYLIRWEGYPLMESTWEPEENIEGQVTFDKWNEEKMKIAKGYSEAFDVVRFEQNLADVKNAKDERKRRRKEKRKRHGVPISPSEPDAEDFLPAANHDSDSSVEAEEVIEEPDDAPGIAAPSQRPGFRLGPRLKASVVDDIEEDDVLPLNIRRRRRRRQIDESDDSLAEDPKQKLQKRKQEQKQKHVAVEDNDESQKQKRKLRQPKSAVKKDAAKALEFLHDESSSASREASPLEVFPKSMQQKTALAAEPLSRTGYQGTANRGSGALTAASRARGAAATRGSTRGRGRGLTRGGGFSFVGHNAASTGPVKHQRGLGNALLNATKADPGKPMEHFKTPSMIRKAELAGRALADRAPDLASIGPLVAPSAYNGPRQKISKRPQGAKPEGLHKNSELEPSHQALQSHVEGNTPHAALENNHTAFDKESGELISPEVVTKTGEDMVELAARKAQLKAEIARRASEIAMHPMNNVRNALPPGTPTGPRAIVQAQYRKAPGDYRFDGAQKPTTEFIQTERRGSAADEVKGTTIQTESKSLNSPQQPAQPPKSVTKIKFNDYKSRRMFEPLGDAISVRAVFGDTEAQPVLIAFPEIDKNAQDSWIKTLRALEKLAFDRICLAQDFRSQTSFLQGRILASGSISTDSNGGLVLEEIAECLRPLFGLTFSHSDFSILIFPAKCEEWNFLEATPNANQNTTLRYQIFNTTSYTAVGSYDAEAKLLISSIDLERNYLESFVDLTQGLEYQTFLPSQTQDQDVHNFFLLFPPKAASSANFIATWLRFCNRDCRVFTNKQSGSWDTFTNNSTFHAGAIIIHESLVPSIFKIPRLYRLLHGNSNFNLWYIGDGSSAAPFYSHVDDEESKPTCGTTVVRLFPHGGAVCLTPNFLIAQPEKTYDLLRWFQRKVATSTTGTWKLVVAYNCRQYLLNLAIQRASEYKELYASSSADREKKIALAESKGWSRRQCELRFLSYGILEELMKKELMAGYPDYWDETNPDESECPVVYADESINPDDEKGLANWFAGWTMLRLNLFRKFIIVGTSPPKGRLSIQAGTNTSVCSHILPDSAVSAVGRLAELEEVPIEAEVKHSSLSTPSLPPPTSNPGVSTASRNAPAPELARACEEESLSMDVNDDDDSKLRHSSRSSHGIDKTTQESVLNFIAVTGADKRTAERYIERYNNDFHTAAQKYLFLAQTSSSPTELSQFDVADNVKDSDAVLDVIAGTHASRQDAHEYLHLAQDDVRRAIEIFQKGQELSRSPSRGPPNHDGVDEKETDGGSGSPSRSGVLMDEAGRRRFIPSSIRPSGTTHPEISLRPGYVPPEDNSVYKNRRVVNGVLQYGVGDMASPKDSSKSNSTIQSPVVTGSDERRLSMPGCKTRDVESGVPKSMDGGGQDRANFEFTTDWYAKLKSDGQSWGHILVGGWETCFKSLQIKRE